MIKYICHHCDDLTMETSTCPICNQRSSILETAIYYCPECNTPVFDDTCPVCHSACKRVGTDARPVFAQERLLLEVLLGKPMEFAGKLVWSTKSTTYLIDGEPLNVNLKKLQENDPSHVIEELKKYEEENQKYVDEDFTNEHVKRFVAANQYRLNMITAEAVDYIKNISKDFDTTSMFVSFSGGKDSTVTSHLVMNALGTEQVLHIYGDTTLEYPESEKYLKVFRKTYPKTPVLVSRNNEQDFYDLSEIVGPPSRVLRWCCTVFKTGAITKKIEQVFQDRNKILSFQGIRRNESNSRSKYDRDSMNSKISKQIASSPIIDWLDYDIWLYILSNQLPINNAYRQGFTRVGCWCCPNNSGWSEYLSSIYMPEEYARFHDMLYKFAQKVGKEDWKTYVDDGKWKARQGGNGLEYSKNTMVEFTPCALEADAYNFELTKPISENLYTYFKPFGKLNFDMGNKRLNEVYVISRNTGNPLLKLTGRIGKSTLRVTILSKEGPFKFEKNAKDLIKSQLTKYQVCIGCSYCQSVCRFNALKVMNTEPGNVSNSSIRYTIDEDKCVGCLECVKHFDGGCYMKKVLRVKKGAQ